MTDPFEGFMGLLAEEIDLHKRLLALARDEQRALVRSHPSELAMLVARQEAVVAEIRRLEHARLELRTLLAERDPRYHEELTMPILVALAKPEMAARFERLRETLVDVVREVADVNQANALLIRDHIAHLRTVVDVVARAATQVASGSELAGQGWSGARQDAAGDAGIGSRSLG